jgi:RimJ/RimL family protein N-acetyltransferase
VTTDSDPLPRFGSSVVLRRLSVTDLVAFQAYRSDAELGRYQGWSAMPDSEALEFLAEMNAAPLFRPGEWAQIGIAEPQSPALIGDIGLYLSEDSRHAEIGFTLARHAQRRGLATAAIRDALQLIFAFTAVERVVGVTDARNHASIALLERVGMRKVEERTVEFRGEKCIEYAYAIHRADGQVVGIPLASNGELVQSTSQSVAPMATPPAAAAYTVEAAITGLSKSLLGFVAGIFSAGLNTGA